MNLSMTKSKPRFSHIGYILLVCGILMFGVGCSRAAVSGLYVENNIPSEVDMLRLVESPPGHISGTLVVSTIAQDGSRNEDVTDDVAGTVTGSNISLHVNRGSMSRFLGSSNNLVGSIRSNVITLGLGENTIVFRKITQEKYSHDLAIMTKLGQHWRHLLHARHELQVVIANAEKLNTDLNKYIAWGKERIDRVSKVKLWYADRIKSYTKCLQVIRPLSAEHVLAWHWQRCVSEIDNDAYVRGREINDIHNLGKQNRRVVDSLNGRIKQSIQRYPEAIHVLNAACDYATKLRNCKRMAHKLDTYSPYGPLDKSLVKKYKAMIPEIRAAIGMDVKISSNGDKKLTDIAKQVDSLYQGA